MYHRIHTAFSHPSLGKYLLAGLLGALVVRTGGVRRQQPGPGGHLGARRHQRAGPGGYRSSGRH